MTTTKANAEQERLAEAAAGTPWRKWGPYLSERQWGTVREDYSPDGNAWNYFTHDQARSRAYRWGEDGLAGFSDEKQRLCFALGLWNGEDSIIKERLFGLANSEGNHGEDVKEYYFYLDSTPTHSYMKWLYKYPQRAYPYDDLVTTNGRRSNRNWSTNSETPGSSRTTATSTFSSSTPRPRLRTSSFGSRSRTGGRKWRRFISCPRSGSAIPGAGQMETRQAGRDCGRLPRRREPRRCSASHPEWATAGDPRGGDAPLLFTENETNNERVFGTTNAGPYVKDGINDCVVHGFQDAVNPGGVGTKVAADHVVAVAPAGASVLRLRLTDLAPGGAQSADELRGFRRVTRAAPRRGRRVLPRDHPRFGHRRRSPVDAAGSGRHALEQTAL